MRVLWLTHVYPRHAGDMFGGFLHRLAGELVRKGIAVRVVAPWHPGAEPSGSLDGVEIRRFRYPGDERNPLAYSGEMHRKALASPLAFVRFLGAMRRAIHTEKERWEPDIAHAHWWIPGGLATATGRWGRTRLALSVHGTDVRLMRSFPAARPLAGLVIRRFHQLLPVSSALADRLRDVAGSVPVRVLPMPVDGDVFRPGSAERPPADRPVFTAAARLTTQKRVRDAIVAVSELRKSGLDARLVIAGDGPERGNLEREAASQGVADLVDFRGTMNPVALAEMFRTSTAVVLPSVDEGFGLTIVEAALTGTPGIGVRSGGITDTIDHERTGLLVEPLRPSELADAMRRMAADPRGARSMGERALESARERAASPTADRLLDVYRRLLDA
ncbi:glycosyltransferase [bacterium]|nr:glycosyltransferase [bacterium]